MNERDRGAAEVLGLVLIVPAALGLALLVLWTGRQVDGRAQVSAAATTAAQAAARQRNAGNAATAAERAVAAALDGDTCAGGPSVGTDTSAWTSAGEVTVTVTCAIVTADLAPLAAPRVVRITATAPVDRLRSVGLP